MLFRSSLESHVKNALLLDLRVLVCKEDLEGFGLTEDSIVMDAEEIGGEVTTQVVPYEEIQQDLESADHLMFF